jgi:DNA topoisomerase IB
MSLRELDPSALADEADLVYVSDAIPGITRERGPDGWSYRRRDGTVITINAAPDAAAARLNNTRAVCRQSYVNPRIPEAYLDGTLDEAFRRDRSRERFSRSEAALSALVGQT